MAANLPLISVVIPAYNEEAGLPAVFARVSAVADALAAYRFEMIVLDNCSVDRTRDVARAQCQRDPRWRYVRYSRNFGAEASLLAGLDFAAGDAVINLFSDLQDPPEKIPEMIELWARTGAGVVYGVVHARNDSSALKTLGAKIAYRLIYLLAECKIPANATDFRLMDRAVVNVLREMREPDRYMRGLVHWVGFRQEHFTYDRAKRKTGSSSANLVYCVKFALHAIVCFSSKPMHFAMLFGALLTTTSALLAVFYLLVYFLKPAFLTAPPTGVTTIILLILFILGFNSLFLGIIGEYVGRIYNQGKHRPLYIVAEKAGYPDERR